MKPRRRSGAAVLAFAAVSAMSAWGADAETPRSLWQSQEELLAWTGIAGVERLSEGDLAFVRLGPGVRADLVGGRACRAEVAWERVACPVLLNPGTHDAVRLTIRHTRPWSRLGGRWVHRKGQVVRHEYGGRYLRLGPSFEPVEVPGDGHWHDVTLRLADSALFDPTDPVIWAEIGPFDPGREGVDAKVEPEGPPAGFLDLARVEFLRLGQALEPPVVTSVSPRRSPRGAEVTIRGSGFAVPADRNMVLFGLGWRAEAQAEPRDEDPDRFGQTRAEVLGGDAGSLRVRIVPRFTSVRDVAPLEVRTPGGGRVVVDPQYVLLGSSGTTVLGGGGQRGRVGTRLLPLIVRVTDHLYGVPGRPVRFTIAWGGGTLSVTEAVTDEDGLASTVLTLGPTPGPVVVAVVMPPANQDPQYVGFIALPGHSGRVPSTVDATETPPVARPQALATIVAGALRDPSPQVRSAAAVALARPYAADFDLARGDPVGVPGASENALRHALEDPKREVRVAATIGLGWMRQRAFLRSVERVRDPELSRAARLALAMSQREPLALRELHVIIAALTDPDVHWREAAAAALGRPLAESSPALPGLRAALRDPEAKVRRAAANSLRATFCADVATLAALAETLKDGDSKVREAATRATNGLVPWQRRSPPTWEDPRRNALPALMGLRDPELSVSRRTAAALADIAPEGLPPAFEHALLDAAAHPDAKVRRSAAMALAGLKVRGREVRPGEMEATRWLAVLRAMKDADPDVRAWAEEARLRLPSPTDTALPRIVAGLGWDAVRALQRLGLNAATALARIRAAAAVGAKHDARLRDDAAEAMVLLGAR